MNKPLISSHTKRSATFLNQSQSHLNPKPLPLSQNLCGIYFSVASTAFSSSPRSYIALPVATHLASCQQAILLENMETPGFIPSEPETLTGSNSTESLNGLDDGPIKFQDDPALDIDIKDVTNDLDEMLREVGRLNKAQSQTMINLNKDLETMISEASDVNRKNQKLLNKNKNKGEEEEEEVEEKEEGISGISRKSLSSMFKKKKERARPVSILL